MGEELSRQRVRWRQMEKQKREKLHSVVATERERNWGGDGNCTFTSEGMHSDIYIYCSAVRLLINVQRSLFIGTQSFSVQVCQ